jgi:uncharacterized protein involved in exopolysaccharide biosynthesis
MTVAQLIEEIRTNWWIIVASILIAGGGAAIYSYSREPVYETSATFVANPSIQISNTEDVLNSLDTLAGRSALVTTFCEVLDSNLMLQRAAQQLNLPAELVEMYTVEENSPLVENTAMVDCVVLPDSNILRLVVRGPSPELTADLANAIGAQGIDYVKGLQEVFELRELDNAVPEPKPVTPNHTLDIIFGILIGLIGGVGIVSTRVMLAQESTGGTRS